MRSLESDCTEFEEEECFSRLARLPAGCAWINGGEIISHLEYRWPETERERKKGGVTPNSGVPIIFGQVFWQLGYSGQTLYRWSLIAVSILQRNVCPKDTILHENCRTRDKQRYWKLTPAFDGMMERTSICASFDKKKKNSCNLESRYF